MKAILAIACLSLLVWNIVLTRQMGRIAELAEHIKTESLLSLTLAKDAQEKATGLAILARNVARNTTIIVVRPVRAAE